MNKHPRHDRPRERKICSSSRGRVERSVRSAQLLEAKRLRADHVPAGANAAALDAVGLLSEAPLAGWDDSIRRIRTALTTALGLADTLEELHEHIDAFSPSRASHKRVMIAKGVC